MAIDDSRWITAKYGKNLGPDKVETGSTPLAPSSPAAAGQTDATLRNDYTAANAADKAQREEVAAKKAQVLEITQPSNEPAEDETVTLGNLSIFKNPLLNTYEAQFTRGGTASYIVAREGQWLLPGEAVKAIYDALKAGAR
jgi:hypothetical protein